MNFYYLSSRSNEVTEQNCKSDILKIAQQILTVLHVAIGNPLKCFTFGCGDECNTFVYTVIESEGGLTKLHW